MLSNANLLIVRSLFFFNIGSSDPAWSLNAVYQFLSYLGEKPRTQVFSKRDISRHLTLSFTFFRHLRLCACLNDHLLNFIWFMVNVKAILNIDYRSICTKIDFSSKADINQNVTTCFDSLLFIDSV